MSFPFIRFSQPAGDFLLAAIPAEEIIRISKPDPRKFDNVSMETVGGIQREPSAKRIREIAEYADTVDAAFPTPVLLALSSEDCTVDGRIISIERDKIADIVDGQHRVLGLMQAQDKAEFVIPVVLMIDATEEQKALIFATINGKQTKVPASLIYELFGVTQSRSPQKTAHEIARAMNSTPTSAWYRRLKMLGKKTTAGSIESLSQGTFVKFLLPHISSRPDEDMDLLKQNKPLPVREKSIFNEYFRLDQDSTILKILFNVFQAARDTWPHEWKDPDTYVLTKTLGFSGIMRALTDMFLKGKKDGDLSVDYFKRIFGGVKTIMSENGMMLTSEYFSASASGEADFRNMIIAALSHL